MATTHAKIVATSGKKSMTEMQKSTEVRVHNSVLSEMRLLKVITWAGNQGTPPIPNSIEVNTNAFFKYEPAIYLGSKAAVIYEAPNLNGDDCAWVLAWNAPANPSPTSNKVYVYCDTKANVENMSDNTIGINLNLASDTWVSNAPGPKTRASAVISYSSEIETVTVEANFGLLP